MEKKKYLHIALFSILMAIFFIVFITLSYLSYLNLIFSANDILFYIITAISFVALTFSSIATIRNNRAKTKMFNKKTKRCIITSLIIFTIVYTLFIALSKYNYCFGAVDAEQIFYHTFVSSAGMDFSTVFAIAIPSIVGCIIFASISSYIYFALSIVMNGAQENLNTKVGKKISAGALCSSIISVLLLLSYLLYIIPIFNFVYYQIFTESSFIADNYVDPKTTAIEFPEQKRNLIYIYLESMENTFADQENGGAFKDNYIPEITQLQKDNINFSNTDEIGGALPTYGITYTTASIFAQSFGLPLKIGTNAKPMPDALLPNKYNIYDILNNAGYSQYIVMGSDVNFGGLKELFQSHGNTTIYDYCDMVDTGFIDKNYKVFWGVEDKLVYDYSKEKLSEIAQKKEPFFFVMETVDTHNPNGYICSECKSDFDEQYSNVVACASRQLDNFIKWAKQQEWYKNTTIVVVGDHCSMKNDFFTEIPSKYQRTTTNIIINPDPSLSLDSTIFTNRQFSSMDMLPTTLASIGCKIDGERLGLGTNLFSDRKTIFEEFGFEYVNEEFRKKTTLYENIFNG